MKISLANSILISACALSAIINSPAQEPISETIEADNLWIFKENRPMVIRQTALPLGTGQTGYLMFEKLNELKLELNHNQFWTGSQPQASQAIKNDHIAEINNQLLSGEDGTDLFKDAFSIEGSHDDIYLPVADLVLDFPGLSEYPIYERVIDLKQGIVRSTYLSPTNTVERTLFYSPEDNILGIHMISSNPRMLKGKVYFRSRMKEAKSSYTARGYFWMEGSAIQTRGMGVRELVPSTTTFDARILPRILHHGRMTMTYKDLQFDEATEFMLFVRVEAQSVDSENPTRTADLNIEKLEPFRQKPWDEVLNAHIKSHQALMGRASIHVANATEEKIKEQLLLSYNNLGAHFFVSSTYKNPIPLGDGGIWNHSTRATSGAKPFLSQAMLNLSTLPTLNLPEATEALSTIARQQMEKGKIYAKMLGIENEEAMIIPDATDKWNNASYSPSINRSAWTLSGLWLSHLIKQNINSYGNKVLKPSEFHSLLEGNAAFVLSFFFSDDQKELKNKGWLMASPYGSGKDAYAMNLQILLQFFQDYLQVHDRDSQGLKHFQSISKAKTLIENQLIEQFQSDNKNRKPWAYWGIYPGHIIDNNDNESLNSLFAQWNENAHQNIQTAPRSGTEILWKLGIQTATGNVEEVLDGLNSLNSKTYLSPNGLNNDKLQGPSNIIGIRNILLSLLIKSEPNGTRLLPHLEALPWQEGSLSNVSLPNGAKASVSWENQLLSEVTITGTRPTKVNLLYKNMDFETFLESGSSKTVKLKDFQ